MMIRRIMIWGLLLIFLGGAVTSAADWPRFMGPDGNGISQETGLNKDWKAKKPVLLWKVSLKNNGYSGPSTADGMVFIIDRSSEGAQDQVNAYNLKTGKMIWKYTYKEDSFENYGYARTTPTYDSGKLYTLSMLGMLFCFDAKTGKKLWTLNTQKEFEGNLPDWQLACSPVIDGEKLLICPGGSTNLVALDKNTGKTVWRGGNKELIGYATPVVGKLNGVRQYIIFTGKSVIGVSPENGAVLWRYPWVTEYDANVASPIIYGENQVFITSGYAHGCAMLEVDPKGAVNLLWENKDISSHFSSPILYQNYLFSNDDNGSMICMDPSTGAVRWRKSGFEKGGLIIADEVILALGGSSGDLVMVKADGATYKELGRLKAPLGGQSWTAPILANGLLIIRNQSGMACYDLK